MWHPMMARLASLIGLLAAVGLGSIAPAYAKHPLGENCDAELTVFEHSDYFREARRHRRALNQVGILRIVPSSDPWLLFERFAMRLSVVAPTGVAGDDRPPRDIRSIVASGSGDREELAFVLLNLFTVNGFETETVHIYSYQDDPEKMLSDETVERVLVYLPILDWLFDPTLPAAEQHKGAGRKWLNDLPRIHRGYPIWRMYDHGCPSSAFRGYYGKRSP
jgi:hypothetical protein